MDRVTLVSKGITFMARFAAPSVLTGNFVAAIQGVSRSRIEEAFAKPGNILVHNEDDLYSDKLYEGYKRIKRISEQDNETTVVLDKEGQDERDQGE